MLTKNNSKKLISLEELATILKYDLDYLRKKCKELGFTQNGVKTMLNEEQVEEIRKILVPRTLDMKVQAQNTNTSISIKENFLKATQDYIALINQEKEEYKKMCEEKDKTIGEYKLTIKGKIDKDKLFSTINTKIREIGKRNAGCFASKDEIGVEISKTYNYYYSELQARHNLYHSVNMKWLRKKENIQYAKELLEILLSDIEK